MLIMRNSGFNKVCGTSNIINYKLVMSGVDRDITTTTPQQDMLDLTDEYYTRNIIGSHKYLEGYFSGKGYPLEYLPFYGAVHLVGTGENHSDFIGYTQQMRNSINSSDSVLWSEITNEHKEIFSIPG